MVASSAQFGCVELHPVLSYLLNSYDTLINSCIRFSVILQLIFPITALFLDFVYYI